MQQFVILKKNLDSWLTLVITMEINLICSDTEGESSQGSPRIWSDFEKRLIQFPDRGGVHFVMKPETATHPRKGGTVPAGTLHWHSLPRVPTAVTSTQTMRDGSTVLHHNIFRMNCDFPEGSSFQTANHLQSGHSTCNLFTSWFCNSTDTCSKHPPLALREVTMCSSSLLSRLLTSPMALRAVTVPMGGFR